MMKTGLTRPSIRTADEPTLVRPEFRVDTRDEGVTLRVAVPGVPRENLTISALQGTITIEGRRAEATDESWKTIRGSAPSGYRLEAKLRDNLDDTRIEARLESGVLELSIPIREEAKPRRIELS